MDNDFRLEFHRERILRDGSYVDFVLMSVLEHEWQALRGLPE